MTEFASTRRPAPRLSSRSSRTSPGNSDSWKKSGGRLLRSADTSPPARWRRIWETTRREMASGSKAAVRFRSPDAPTIGASAIFWASTWFRSRQRPRFPNWLSELPACSGRRRVSTSWPTGRQTRHFEKSRGVSTAASMVWMTGGISTLWPAPCLELVRCPSRAGWSATFRSRSMNRHSSVATKRFAVRRSESGKRGASPLES